MSILVVGTVRLPADRLDAARPAMRAMVEASRAEDGCIAYAYAEDVLDRGLIRVHEEWRDLAALERHLATPHLAMWRATWPSLQLGERHLVRYVVGAPRAT